MSSKSKMVCKHGLNDIWIDRNVGRVRMCGWTNYYLGNLSEHTFAELWHGEKANTFRESLLDGSYRFCNPAKCPHCANENLEDHLVDYYVQEFPYYINLCYQLDCNYACKFCRNEIIINKCDYEKIENEIKALLPHAKCIGMNGAGEIFCSQSIISLIQNTEFDKGTDFLIESNGSLFNEKNWDKISKLGKHNLSVAITVHSFIEQTYQYLSGTKLPVRNIIDNLKFISSLRDKGIVNSFEIATVVCERNFSLDNFSMDTIRLRFFEPYGVMDKVTEWFYDVRNPYHPYHDEFIEVMKNPIFENPKVWKWQGETESLQRESHYELEHRNIVDFSKLFRCEDLKNRIEEWKKRTNYTEIALYGASYLGKDYQKLLSENGLKISTIFDTYAAEVEECGYRIKHPSFDELNRYQCILITNNTVSDGIKEELVRNRYNGKAMLMCDFITDLGVN